jgi:hypothetical protein
VYKVCGIVCLVFNFSESFFLFFCKSIDEKEQILDARECEAEIQ